MGYSESLSWKLPVDKVPAHKTGDKITFNIMGYPEVGQGADDIAKAQYLNTAEVTGSAWSADSSVTFN